MSARPGQYQWKNKDDWKEDVKNKLDGQNNY